MFIAKLIRALIFSAGPKYRWKKVVLVLTLSTLATSGSALLSYSIYRYIHHLQASRESDVIQAIAQTGPKSKQLQTAFLAEVLDLSLDLPTNLGRFDLDDAAERLLGTFVIQNVRLKKVKPHFLWVDYTAREPFALLEDYSNTVMDEQGLFFPLTPFYSPRTLPSIYLGEQAPPSPWGQKIGEAQLKLVHTLTKSLDFNAIERIDISQVTASSSGKQEIVVFLKGGNILRLAPKNCVQQLLHYSILKQTFLNDEAQSFIVDLRIPEVAFLKRLTHAR